MWWGMKALLCTMWTMGRLWPSVGMASVSTPSPPTRAMVGVAVGVMAMVATAFSCGGQMLDSRPQHSTTKTAPLPLSTRCVLLLT